MKNKLLFSTLLLIATGAFAQLTVKPNGTNDSYIYVKDQILYVEEGIALTRNPTPALEASIYLRDSAQLIQGGTTSSNTGDGFLSVQQTSPVTNAWAYYYWCSPVGQPVTSMGNDNFGIGLLYDPVGSSLTHAVPVNTTTSHNGMTGDPITVSTRWLYTHVNPGTEAEGNYQRMNAGYTAPPGFGFTMKGVGAAVPGLPQLYEFRGRPNNGSFEIEVQGPAYISGGGDVNARMTLTGNPYPSALDLNRVFYETGNEPISAFYFYDEDRDVASHYYSEKPFGYGVWVPGEPDFNGLPEDTGFQEGAFVNAPFYFWNAAGGTTTTAGNGTETVSHRFAPIGQGIMFVGTNPNNPETIFIKNTHRRYIKQGTEHSVFHRPSNQLSTNTNTETPVLSTNPQSNVDHRTPQTRFYVVFDSAVTRDLLLTFSDQATDGYDRGMDGLSPMGLKTDAYFPVGPDANKLPYVINSVNYDEDKQIAFAIKLDKITEIKLLLAEEINKPYQKIFLYDSQENTYRRLGTQSTHPFRLTLPAGNYDNRFFIVFKKAESRTNSSTASLEEQNKIVASVGVFQNNPQRQLEISNPEGQIIKSAIVYDMNGKTVIQEKNLGANKSYSFHTGNLSDGVYLVKLITADDISVDYKAIVHNN